MSSLQEDVCMKVLKDDKCLSEPYGENVESKDHDGTDDSGKSKGDKRKSKKKKTEL